MLMGGSWLTHKTSEAGSSTRSVFKAENGKQKTIGE